MKKVYWFVILMITLMAQPAQAETPWLELPLIDAEQKAVSHSQKLKVKQLELEAAKARTASQASLFWPQLSLEGSINYMTELAELELHLPMGNMSMQLGDHTSYSLGALAVWNLWDSGKVYYNWKATEHAEKAKELEVILAEEEVILKVRLAYFKTQIFLEQVNVLKNAVNLSGSQYQDIKNKQLAGVVSRADVLASHLELLNQSNNLRRAKTDLSDTIRELMNLTGLVDSYDLTYPMSFEHAEKMSKQDQSPSVLFKFDKLKESIKTLSGVSEQNMDSNHPRSAIFGELAKMARRVSFSIESNHWPSIQVSGKSGIEYPNNMVAETVYQNRAGAQLKWPIFQGGYVSNLEKEQAIQSQSYEHQFNQASIDIKLEWLKAHDKYKMLREEASVIDQVIDETKKLTDMVYQSYLAGKSDYIRVQSSNLKILESETKSVQNYGEQLIQLAILDSLAIKKMRENRHEAQ